MKKINVCIKSVLYLHNAVNTVSAIILRRNCTPILIEPVFVHYLKIIKLYLKNSMIILKQIVKETKDGIRILKGPVVLELLSKYAKYH